MRMGQSRILAKNMETKKEIRKRILTERLALEPEECENASHSICIRLLEQKWYKDAQNICVYMAIKQEADLLEFIQQAWKDGKNIYAPRIYKPKNLQAHENIMDFYAIGKLSDLEQGSFGVLEPVQWAHMYVPKEPTILFVPGVAFSMNGNRIGYGKGYYDRYLQKYRDEVYPIGIAYELQLLDAFQTEKQDIPMTEIITEKRKVTIYDEAK